MSEIQLQWFFNQTLYNILMLFHHSYAVYLFSINKKNTVSRSFFFFYYLDIIILVFYYFRKLSAIRALYNLFYFFYLVLAINQFLSNMHEKCYKINIFIRAYFIFWSFSSISFDISGMLFEFLWITSCDDKLISYILYNCDYTVGNGAPSFCLRILLTIRSQHTRHGNC